jgi:hypothetical protein
MNDDDKDEDEDEESIPRSAPPLQPGSVPLLACCPVLSCPVM